MQFSCLQVLSFILLLAGTGLIIASVATSNWSEQLYAGTGGFSYVIERGLWLQCVETRTSLNLNIQSLNLNTEKKDCKNRFEFDGQDGLTKDNLTQHFQTWEIACIALMSGSALLGLLTLIFSPCCCNRCPCCLVLWTLLAKYAAFVRFYISALCCAAGLGVFAYEMKNNSNAGQSTVTSEQVSFGWSFWLAVAGGGAQLLSTIFFGISRARVSYDYSSAI